MSNLLHLANKMDISPGKLPWLYYGTFRGYNHYNTFTFPGVEKIVVRTPRQTSNTLFISSLTHSFRVGFKNPPSKLHSAYKNLAGALEHPQVVDDYLQAEIAEKRVIGPFCKADIPDAHISKFGVIPKHHKPNKWRLIVDLSHPADFSVNAASQKSYVVSLTLQ